MTNRLLVAAASMLAAAILVAAPAQASAALTHGAVHLLSGPAPTFVPVADVPGNSQVGVLWCGPANFDWCLVDFHKKRGWVHGADLTALGAKASVADADGNGAGGSSAAAGTGGGSGGAASRSTEGVSHQQGTGPNAGSVGSGGSHAVGSGL
jgi:uncharacterized protein YraI